MYDLIKNFLEKPKIYKKNILTYAVILAILFYAACTYNNESKVFISLVFYIMGYIYSYVYITSNESTYDIKSNIFVYITLCYSSKVLFSSTITELSINQIINKLFNLPLSRLSNNIFNLLLFILLFYIFTYPHSKE